MSLQTMPGGNVIAAIAGGETAEADGSSTGWRQHPAVACLVEAGIRSSAATGIVRALRGAISRSDANGEIARVRLSPDQEKGFGLFMATRGASNFRAVLSMAASTDSGTDDLQLTLGDDRDRTWFVLVEEPMLLA